MHPYKLYYYSLNLMELIILLFFWKFINTNTLFLLETFLFKLYFNKLTFYFKYQIQNIALFFNKTMSNHTEVVNYFISPPLLILLLLNFYTKLFLSIKKTLFSFYKNINTFSKKNYLLKVIRIFILIKYDY